VLYVVYHTINQHNIRFLAATAQLDEILQKKANATYPSAPITWVLQGPPPDLSDLPDKGFPGTAEGYLQSALHTMDRSADGREYDEGSAQGKLNSILRYIKKKYRMNSAAASSASSAAARSPAARQRRMYILGTPSSDSNGSAYPYLQPSQYLPSYTAELALLKQALRAAAAAKRADGHTVTGTFLQHFLPSLIELVNSVQQVGDELLESIAEGLKSECAEALDGDLMALEAELPMLFPDLEACIGAVNASLATCFDGGVLGRVPGAAVVHRRFRLSRRELMLTLQRSAAALADSNGNAVATGCAELRNRYHDALGGMVDSLLTRSDAFFDDAAKMEANFTAACRLEMLEGVPAKAEARRRLADAIARSAADLEKHRRIMRYRAFESTAWVLGLAAFGMMLVVYVGVPLHPSIRALALLCLAPYLVIWLRSNLRALQGWVVPER
jgi:hypothetical protein